MLWLVEVYPRCGVAKGFPNERGRRSGLYVLFLCYPVFAVTVTLKCHSLCHIVCILNFVLFFFVTCDMLLRFSNI